MQEIEIKAVLRDSAGVRAKLEALGCIFTAPVRQEDEVYVEELGDVDTFVNNHAFLRIRSTDSGKILLTAKTKGKVALAPLEHEITISSVEEARGILEMMGYKKAVEVRKARTKTNYNGCEICLDEVENLGSFIEMEKLSEDGDAGAIQEELFAFFETLGISRDDRVTKGYDILMIEKLTGQTLTPGVWK